MKNLIRILTYGLSIIAVVAICSGCYLFKDKEMISFYKKQQHDPDLVGYWVQKIAPNSDLKADYKADGSVITRIGGANYWYTKAGVLYTMHLGGDFASPKEMTPVEYSFSEDKIELWLSGEELPYIRTPK